jgi:mono/diheme cytochrome c family protein
MKCVLQVRRGILLPLLTGFSLSGCYKKVADPVTSTATFIPAGVTTTNVTHTNYVSIVLKNNCSTCHGKGGVADSWWLNENTYQNAAEYGSRIVETIENGSMPPVPRKPWSDADKEMMKAWLNKGMPQ